MSLIFWNFHFNFIVRLFSLHVCKFDHEHGFRNCVCKFVCQVRVCAWVCVGVWVCVSRFVRVFVCLVHQRIDVWVCEGMRMTLCECVYAVPSGKGSSCAWVCVWVHARANVGLCVSMWLCETCGERFRLREREREGLHRHASGQK